MAASIHTQEKQPAVSVQDIVSFVDEVSNAPIRSVGRRVFDIAGSVEERDHSIHSVLGRATELGTFTWSTSHVAGTVLATGTMNSDYFRNHANAVQKIAGFGYMRADATLRALANVQPGATGALILVALPQAPYTPAANDATLAWWTGFDHALMNVGVNNSVELSLPYVNYRLWSDIDAMFSGYNTPQNRQLYDHAMWALVVASPLDVGTDNIDVTIFASLSDVEVKMPVDPKAPPVTEYRIQSAESHKFRGAVDATAGVFRDVGGAVKGVTSIVGAAGATIEPCTLPPVPINPLGIQRSMAQLYGPDGTVTHGASQDARVALPEGAFGTGSEMDLSQYASRAALYDDFRWQSTDAKGTIIAAYEINPVTLPRLAAGAAGAPMRWATIPLSYVALMFRWWRGGIRFKFHVITNSFYSGRIRFVYMPLDRTSRGLGSVLTPEVLGSVQSEIVDLTRQSEIELNIPYVNNAPWKELNVTDVTAGDPTFQDTKPLGFVYAVVQQPLVASASVVGNSFVRVLTYKSAMPGAKFAGLIGRALPCFSGEVNPYRTVVVEPTPGIRQENKKACPKPIGPTYKIQASSTEGETVLMPTVSAPPPPIVAPMCMSEEIGSWRDVVHRMMPIPASTYPIFATGRSLAELESVRTSPIYYARMAFAYYTGSLRVAASSQGPLWYAAGQTTSLSPSSWSSALLLWDGDASVCFSRFPWMDEYPFLPTGQGSLASVSTNAVTGFPTPRRGFISGPAPAYQMIGAGDDYVFGYPVGTPPVALYEDVDGNDDLGRYQPKIYA